MRTMTRADDKTHERFDRPMQPSLQQLLEAGVHFGHQTRRWNPKMRRFIFAERNGIHIIDLQKTLRQLELAQKLVREVVLRGENVLFVCTKRQLGAIVQGEAERCGAMYVTERWLGGLLTNFQTVKKQTRRLKELEAGSAEGGEWANYTKKEQLMMSRQRDKLSKNLSGIDDAIRSVELITKAIADSVNEARREAPAPRDEEEGEGSTYSSERGVEAAAKGGEDDRRRRRPRRRRAKPEAIAALRKPGAEGEAEPGEAGAEAGAEVEGGDEE